MGARFVGAAVVLTLGALSEKTAIAQQRAVPRFEVDARVPQLPATMMIGGVGGVSADRNGNIWAFNRPHRLPESNAMLNGYKPAPPVIPFDPSGKYLQGWGGPSPNGQYDWPYHRGGQHRTGDVERPGRGTLARGNGDRRPGGGEHGIFVDHQDNVWLTGNGPGDGQVLKFFRDGKLLLQIQAFTPEASSSERGTTSGSRRERARRSVWVPLRTIGGCRSPTGRTSASRSWTGYRVQKFLFKGVSNRAAE